MQGKARPLGSLGILNSIKDSKTLVFSAGLYPQNIGGEMAGGTPYQRLSQAFISFRHHFSSQKWQNCQDCWQNPSLQTKPRPVFLLALISSLVWKIQQSRYILSCTAGCLQTLHLPYCISTCKPERQLKGLCSPQFRCQHSVYVIILVFPSSTNSCYYNGQNTIPVLGGIH